MAPSLSPTHPHKLGEEFYQFEILALANGEDFDVDLGDIYERLWYWAEDVSGAAYAVNDLILRDGSATGNNIPYPVTVGVHVRPTATAAGTIYFPGQLLNFQNVNGSAQVIIVHVLALAQK